MNTGKLILFVALIGSCTSSPKEKKYTLIIDLMDPKTKTVSSKELTISAKDDTSAYQIACSRYWSTKLAVMETIKRFETIQPVPFFFSVNEANGTKLNYSKEDAERLTKSIMDYVNNKALPAIDTITPISKMPKNEPAKIY